MFRRISIFIVALGVLSGARGSEAVQAGYVKGLSYRQGYVNFQVVGDDGSNYCSACPTDPSAMGAQRCWIAESQKTEVSMILLASAQNKKISGRVVAFASDCGVYQLSIQD